jgi:hypothetical protein
MPIQPGRAGTACGLNVDQVCARLGRQPPGLPIDCRFAVERRGKLLSQLGGEQWLTAWKLERSTVRVNRTFSSIGGKQL